MADGPPPTVYELVAPDYVARLDRWLADELPISRSQLQALVDQGHVLVDGAQVRRSRSLVGGEAVRVTVPPPPSCELEAQAIPLTVLHMDDDVIVLDKPAGLVVHPSKGHADGTLVNAVLHLVAQASFKAAAADDARVDPTRPGIVHRLDKGTSGVIVVARTPEALTHLAAQFAARTTDREYLALVWGRPPLEGRLDGALGRHPRDRKRYAVREGGKPSVTHFRRIASATLAVSGDRAGGRVSLLSCRLETGRTHQIRVHLTSARFPVIGDPSYHRRGIKRPGALTEALAAVDHQLLHARMLGFTHPTTGERLTFSAPPPDDFMAVMHAAGLTLD